MTRLLPIPLLVLAPVAGCCGSAAPRPQAVALPPLLGDATLNVYSDSRHVLSFSGSGRARCEATPEAVDPAEPCPAPSSREISPV